MTLATPYLWVFFPILMAVLSGIFHKRELLSILLAILSSFALALLAAFFPEDLTLEIGPLVLEFNETMTILGRQLSVVYEIFPFIALIYGMTGLWALSSGFPGDKPSLSRQNSGMLGAHRERGQELK